MVLWGNGWNDDKSGREGIRWNREQNLDMALTSILDDDQVAAALQALRTVVGQLPAGQALQRRIADRDPARSAARPH